MFQKKKKPQSYDCGERILFRMVVRRIFEDFRHSLVCVFCCAGEREREDQTEYQYGSNDQSDNKCFHFERPFCYVYAFLMVLTRFVKML